ncbi:hypothetical protein BDV96DRAFT_642335 [Lophiotrema nucula]|uniref:Uncharacterized protein n=1 Tax=Lophiotrema nucula TaxID=690887 RepID=A0A6A5ZI84_9PLEO|nr:hypothetical protein BDV96DRAFT_642335 [Lophiotrema nucula]
MGVTVSHSTLAPISMASTIIAFIGFGFTLGTFFNVFWKSIMTLTSAPSEIADYLSNLKQGLLEERRHLRRVKRRLKKEERRDASHVRGRSRSGGRDPGGGGGYGGGGGSWEDGAGIGGGGRRSRRSSYNGEKRGVKHQHAHFDRDLQSIDSAGEGASLRAMRVAVRDMIRKFRKIEYPFLKEEYQNQTSSSWSTTDPMTGKNYYTEDEDYDAAPHLARTNRLGTEYKQCGFRERWLWLKRKEAVISLSEGLSRIEVRRTSHEVGEVLMMLTDIGRDLEDMTDSVASLEGRMNRVVGVRRVD